MKCSTLLSTILVSSSILGFADPLPEPAPIISPAATGFNLDWDGTNGNTYFVEYSSDLVTWQYMPVIASGTGGPLGYGFGSPDDRLFLRLKYTDVLTNNALTDDFDGDGISNWDEVRIGGTGTNPFSDDTDGDGLKDKWEVDNGLDPNDDGSTNPDNGATGDPDGDGLTNEDEQDEETNPNDPDSDDDFMPDGWEVEHHGKTVVNTIAGIVPSAPTVSLSPNDSTDAALDPDGDGLTNIEEYRAGSLPYLDDSDGDGASDGDEVANGANPADGADGGEPGGPDSDTVVVDVPFAIGGDYAWWEMNIEGQGPTDTRVQKIHSSILAEGGFGEYEGEIQVVKLHAGNKYKVTMKRMGGVVDEYDGMKWYCWSANVGKDPDADELLPLETTFGDSGYYEPERLEDEAIAYAFTGANEDGDKASWIADNESGLFTQHVDDFGQDTVQSLEAFLLPVEVIIPKLDSQGNPIDREFVNAETLKVAKWENAFSGVLNNTLVKEDFIEWDRDRFYVKIPNGVALGVTSVEIATEDNPDDSSYNDDATEIDMTAWNDGTTSITKSMILVSDDDDDKYAANGAGADDQKNDRTHKVQLGGNLVIKSVTIKGTKHAMNFKIPVPAMVELDLDIYRMNVDGVHTKENIENEVKVLKQYYAQAGLKLNVDVQQVEWPQAVETEKTENNNTQEVGKFHIYTTDATREWGPLNSETKVFIDAVDSSGVNLYFVKEARASKGIAIPLTQIHREPPSSSFNLKYTNKAFINSDHFRGSTRELVGYAMGHELMHLLAHKELDQHGVIQDDHGQYLTNLLTKHNGLSDHVLWSKRIDQIQERAIHSHVEVRRINP